MPNKEAINNIKLSKRDKRRKSSTKRQANILIFDLTGNLKTDRKWSSSSQIGKDSRVQIHNMNGPVYRIIECKIQYMDYPTKIQEWWLSSDNLNQ